MNKEFKIYQVQTGKTREYGFIGLDEVSEYGLELSLENYDMVFTGMVKDGYNKDILENLFYDFNVNHPEYYCGRSMSVSDIVELDGIYYYCDRIGFKEINLK